jgi:transcriptional regulator with XRE-family HTH domain
MEFVPKDLHIIYPNLADNVRKAQCGAGLTQATLASKVGVTRGSITNLIGRKQGASVRVLYAIAQACGVEVCDLLNG